MRFGFLGTKSVGHIYLIILQYIPLMRMYENISVHPQTLTMTGGQSGAQALSVTHDDLPGQLGVKKTFFGMLLPGIVGKRSLYFSQIYIIAH